MVKNVRVTLDDEEYNSMLVVKGERTWIDVLRRGIEALKEWPNLFEIELRVIEGNQVEEIIRRLTPNMITEWLERIPDADLELLNFYPGGARPAWMTAPIFNVEFIEQIHNLLSVTCRSCGSILLDDETKTKLTKQRNKDIELFGKVSDETSNEIMKQAKKYKRYKECPMCGMVQSNIKFIPSLDEAS